MLCQEEARRHFKCPILEGMELENQGGMGTELNHWEKRLLEVKIHSLIIHFVRARVYKVAQLD